MSKKKKRRAYLEPTPLSKKQLERLEKTYGTNLRQRTIGGKRIVLIP